MMASQNHYMGKPKYEILFLTSLSNVQDFDNLISAVLYRSTFIIISNYMSTKPQKTKTGFISKLQAILSNQQLSRVVSWSDLGNSFLILDPIGFESGVLGNYFRHKRMSSFIRQLNMYGFHKQRFEKEALEFYNPFFLKERPDLLAFIQRKKISQLSFKENQPDCNSKEQQAELFQSDKFIPSIKLIQPESEHNNEPSFRLNGSKMTIRLNEALTSLCRVEFDDDVIAQGSQKDSICQEFFQKGEYGQSNSNAFEKMLMPIDEERQISFF